MAKKASSPGSLHTPANAVDSGAWEGIGQLTRWACLRRAGRSRREPMDSGPVVQGGSTAFVTLPACIGPHASAHRAV